MAQCVNGDHARFAWRTDPLNSELHNKAFRFCLITYVVRIAEWKSSAPFI